MKHKTSLAHALDSLEGLSVGDAFGEQFFVDPEFVEDLIERRVVPDPVWRYTDDTMMALSVVESLRLHDAIEPDWLADDFARRYDLARGYGPAMHNYLAKLKFGADWRVESRALFGGQGSYGNGAAMRVAPVGAYFSDDPERVVEGARASALVTHAHPEAVAGAIAVAVAAALAVRLRGQALPTPQAFLNELLPHVPESIVHERIRHARDLDPVASVRLAVSALGNGTMISAQDTVPFALWCAAHHLDNYEEALWLTVGRPRRPGHDLRDRWWDRRLARRHERHPGRVARGPRGVVDVMSSCQVLFPQSS